MGRVSTGFLITEEIMTGKVLWDKLFEPPNFFSKYKHFIILYASSSTSEDQLEYVGLVESKIRHLILALERNDHITLAHINPEQFEPLQPEKDTFSAMWFIGLVFEKTENLNIDLTTDIQAFTAQVHRVSSKTQKENSRIDAKHVRKKQLSSYLPASVLQRNKRQGISVSTSSGSLINGSGTPVTTPGTFAQPRKRPSDAAFDTVAKKIRTRESADVSRNLEGEECRSPFVINSNDDSFRRSQSTMYSHPSVSMKLPWQRTSIKSRPWNQLFDRRRL